MEKINDVSLFMTDSSQSDNKEVVIDYFLSWTLRCASQENINKKYPLVNEYAKIILEALLRVENNTLGQVKSVKTWKQWSKIDLWVEVETEQCKYALLIETKAYSNVHDNQLSRYKEIFDNHYNGTDFHKHYCLFTLMNPVPKEDLEECEKAQGFRAFTMDDIYDSLKIRCKDELQLTGSDFFDEFWFGKWG